MIAKNYVQRKLRHELDYYKGLEKVDLRKRSSTLIKVQKRRF